MEHSVGNVIRDLRRRLGMTQEDFSRAIAVTVWTVNRWENAHAEPSKLAWKAIQHVARTRGLAQHFTADREAGPPAWRPPQIDSPFGCSTEARPGE